MVNTNRIKPSGLIQATSPKQQAVGLDTSPWMGYYGIQGQARDGQAIDICRGPLMGPRNSAAEILQQRPIKSPAIGRNGSCRVMVTAQTMARVEVASCELQAASCERQASAKNSESAKQQAASPELRAASFKPRAASSII